MRQLTLFPSLLLNWIGTDAIVGDGGIDVDVDTGKGGDGRVGVSVVLTAEGTVGPN